MIKNLDFREGDTVQVVKRNIKGQTPEQPDSKNKYIGRVGKIIGIKLRKYNHKDVIFYNLKFSDCEGLAFPAFMLEMVKPAE